ncbi:MAG: leucine-rich repeat protein [Prevotella sp.]|nr:leucine-rich repeat protein [Prevotella sp.]
MGTTNGQYNSRFKGNHSIKTFNEFVHFTGITAIVNSPGGGAFQGASIEEITLPPTLQSMDSTFRGTSLKSITIPASVTSIAGYCFYQVLTLTVMVLLPTTPPTIENNTFYQTPVHFYVPDEAVDDYKTAWSSFASRIHPMSEYTG